MTNRLATGFAAPDANCKEDWPDSSPAFPVEPESRVHPNVLLVAVDILEIKDKLLTQPAPPRDAKL